MKTVNYLFGIVVIPMFTRCHKQKFGSLAKKQSFVKAVNAGYPGVCRPGKKKPVSTPFELLIVKKAFNNLRVVKNKF